MEKTGDWLREERNELTPGKQGPKQIEKDGDELSTIDYLKIKSFKNNEQKIQGEIGFIVK